jgi:hypothetical protein
MEILAVPPLTEVESVLPEEARAINDSMMALTHSSCTHHPPSVASIGAPVPEEHTSMATMFKHFQPHKTPTTTHMPIGFPIPPSMQAIIVDCETVVNPKLASVIRNDAVSVMVCPEDPHASCPAHSKVIISGKARPSATGVPVVYSLSPASHIRIAAMQILASASLAEVEGVLPEVSMAVDSPMGLDSHATRSNWIPSVRGVRSPVSQKHASVTTMLEHFKPNPGPPMEMSGSLPITPTVTAIIVDRVPIVNEQVAPIIRNNPKAIMASMEEPCLCCPTHCKMVTSPKAWPPAASISVIYSMPPTSHMWPSTVQILATTTLTKPESILPEETVTISDAM